MWAKIKSGELSNLDFSQIVFFSFVDSYFFASIHRSKCLPCWGGGTTTVKVKEEGDLHFTVHTYAGRVAYVDLQAKLHKQKCVWAFGKTAHEYVIIENCRTPITRGRRDAADDYDELWYWYNGRMDKQSGEEWKFSFVGKWEIYQSCELFSTFHLTKAIDAVLFARGKSTAYDFGGWVPWVPQVVGNNNEGAIFYCKFSGKPTRVKGDHLSRSWMKFLGQFFLIPFRHVFDLLYHIALNIDKKVGEWRG